MLSSRLGLPLIIGLGVCCLATPRTGQAAEPNEFASSITTQDVRDAGEGQAGSWVHVDPGTGQRIPPPARRAAIPPQAAFSTSHRGLAEVPAPGGGVMVDLQGRFRSATTATVGADGTPHVNCAGPGSAEQGE